MNIRDPLVDSTIHFAALAIGFGVGQVLFGKASFAMLMSWWFSLYVGYVFMVGARAIVPVVVLCILVLAIDIIYGLSLFYPDGASDNSVAYFVVSLTYGLLISVSPILANLLVRYLLEKYGGKGAQPFAAGRRP